MLSSPPAGKDAGVGGLTPVETSMFCSVRLLATEITRSFRCCSSGHASEAESDRQALTRLCLQLPSCRLEPCQSSPASQSHRVRCCRSCTCLPALTYNISRISTWTLLQACTYIHTHTHTYRHVPIYVNLQQHRTSMHVYINIQICV